MMQTAIPCLLFADQPSELKLIGGTNTDFAPDIDYYTMVKFIMTNFQIILFVLSFLFVFANRYFNL